MSVIGGDFKLRERREKKPVAIGKFSVSCDEGPWEVSVDKDALRYSSRNTLN